MHKVLNISVTLLSLLAINSCSSDTEDHSVGMNTHYLTDYYGNGIQGVKYHCSSNDGTTGVDGDYIYDMAKDRCTFILDSDFVGTYQSLYINGEANDEKSGIDGIHYTCINYNTSNHPRTGDTVEHGHFNHNFDYDECTLRY